MEKKKKNKDLRMARVFSLSLNQIKAPKSWIVLIFLYISLYSFSRNKN